MLTDELCLKLTIRLLNIFYHKVHKDFSQGTLTNHVDLQEHRGLRFAL